MVHKVFIDSINSRLEKAIKNKCCHDIRSIVEEMNNCISFPFIDYPKETSRYNFLVETGHKILIKN